MMRMQLLFALFFALISPAWAGGNADLARGVSAEIAQNYDLALQYYDDAILSRDLTQNSQAIAVYNRGNVYLKVDRVEQAIKDYTRAIKLKPLFGEAYSNRALAYGKQGLHELAIEDLSKAIEIDAADALAYVNRGNEYEFLMQHDRALEDWQRAYELGHRPQWLVARVKGEQGS